MCRSEIGINSVSSKKETIIYDSKNKSKSVLVSHTKNQSNNEISNYVTINKNQIRPAVKLVLVS